MFIGYFVFPTVLIAKVYYSRRIDRTKKTILIIFMILGFTFVTMAIFQYIDVQINDHMRD